MRTFERSMALVKIYVYRLWRETFFSVRPMFFNVHTCLIDVFVIFYWLTDLFVFISYNASYVYI